MLIHPRLAGCASAFFQYSFDHLRWKKKSLISSFTSHRSSNQIKSLSLPPPHPSIPVRLFFPLSLFDRRLPKSKSVVLRVNVVGKVVFFFLSLSLRAFCSFSKKRWRTWRRRFTPLPRPKADRLLGFARSLLSALQLENPDSLFFFCRIFHRAKLAPCALAVVGEFIGGGKTRQLEMKMIRSRFNIILCNPSLFLLDIVLAIPWSPPLVVVYYPPPNTHTTAAVIEPDYWFFPFSIHPSPSPLSTSVCVSSWKRWCRVDDDVVVRPPWKKEVLRPIVCGRANHTTAFALLCVCVCQAGNNPQPASLICCCIASLFFFLLFCSLLFSQDINRQNEESDQEKRK